MNLPRWIAALPVRLRSIVRRGRAEKDLDDELSFHLAMKARAARDIGISEAEAARQARLDFRGTPTNEGTVPRRMAVAVA